MSTAPLLVCLLSLLQLSHAFLPPQNFITPRGRLETGIRSRSIRFEVCDTRQRATRREHHTRQPVQMLHLVSSAASALCFWAYETRPSGDLGVREPEDVVMKDSTIEGAGLGLFAARDLKKGTILGKYPGRVWSVDDFRRFKGLQPQDILLDSEARLKLQRERQRKAEVYAWKLDTGIGPDDLENKTKSLPRATLAAFSTVVVLDPTSATGEIHDEVPWIANFAFDKVSTLLCRINEPTTVGGRGGGKAFERSRKRSKSAAWPPVCWPTSADVNVIAQEERDGVTFVLERAVAQGEELFLDYGPYYDRSSYGSKPGKGGGESGGRGEGGGVPPNNV